ncbi:MAG: hypothetical protein OK404_03620 [Thaumarchaeota archaeon]|nr:hypothetical protein [Nitrososphaerota archaeon]
MVSTGLKVLLADAVLLLAEFFATQDIQARVACAVGSPLYGFGCLARSSPAYSYSLFTESFSMIVNGTTVRSPTMLDWVQLTAAALIVINVWYVYFLIRRKPSNKMAGSMAQDPLKP